MRVAPPYVLATVDKGVLGDSGIFDGRMTHIVYRCTSLPDVPVKNTAVFSRKMEECEYRDPPSTLSRRDGNDYWRVYRFKPSFLTSVPYARLLVDSRYFKCFRRSATSPKSPRRECLSL